MTDCECALISVLVYVPCMLHFERPFIILRDNGPGDDCRQFGRMIATCLLGAGQAVVRRPVDMSACFLYRLHVCATLIYRRHVYIGGVCMSVYRLRLMSFRRYDYISEFQ